MFIAIVLITIGFIVLLSYQDWIQNTRLSSKDCDRLLTSISKLILLEEWQEAKKQILNLINKKKTSKKVFLLYIQVLRGTKEFEKALSIAEDHCDEPSFNIEKGKILLEINEPKKALEAFQAAQGMLRTESDFLDLALAYLRAGFPEKCWEIVEPRLSSPFAYAIGAEALLEQKQYQRSLELCQKAIQSGGNSHHLQIQMGTAHRNLGNFALSETIYRKILEKDSGDVIATLGLGACMQEKGLYHKALLIYQSGEAWQKKDPQILKQAALMALYTQRFHFAEKYYVELIALEKPSSEIFSYYGYVLEQQEKWEEAEKVYERQRHDYPNDPHPYRAAAWLFGVGLSRMSQEQGLAFAHRALDLKPDSLSYEILSACEARAGNFETAYAIQEYLATQDKTIDEKKRRQSMLKTLRKNLPLDNQHILRRMVA